MITFARIVECGGISAAAAQLGVDKAAVSRQLRDLEEQLGVRLMHRSTRQLKLTEIGAAVHERAERVLFEVEHAHAEAEVYRATPSGVLTISASVAFGKLHVVPLVARFLQRYPEIEVQLCLLDRQVDPVDEGVDVLLRLCDEPPANMVAHLICPMSYALVCSPALAKRLGKVRDPAQLSMHPCLFYGFKARQATWRFRRDGLDESVQVRTRFSINSSEAVRELALLGSGIALLPAFAIDEDLRTNALVRVLPDHVVQGNLGSSLYAIHLPGRFAPPKARAFVEFVKATWVSDDADGSRWEMGRRVPL